MVSVGLFGRALLLRAVFAERRAMSVMDLLVFDGVVKDVLTERRRQEGLRDTGKFTHTCATPGISDDACLRVLAEEVNEVLDEADALRRALSDVGRMMNDEAGNARNLRDEIRARLRKELIEVAAVAVAWIERVDRATAADRKPFLPGSKTLDEACGITPHGDSTSK
jgi:hypothetical protein